mgnify:CR=1 FL=1
MNGYKGLIYGDYRMLTAKDFSGILTQWRYDPRYIPSAIAN